MQIQLNETRGPLVATRSVQLFVEHSKVAAISSITNLQFKALRTLPQLAKFGLEPPSGDTGFLENREYGV